mmetsp:Transcript_32500/g.68341  ORF Transcript_32500/g.68341 Transcript_32500/m.68341 type:complete len:198 (+) Transcript_32500:411-1004(+)
MPPKSKRNSHPNPRGAARMQPKPKRGKKISSPKEPPSNKRQKTLIGTMFDTEKAVMIGLTKNHKGKRVLLKASKLYSGNPALTMSVLLNPLFGLQSRIIGAGLLKRLQYARARSNLIRNMQDILDRKYPPIDDDSDDEDSKDSEDEEPLPARENSNYTKAEEELLLFESQKRKKYRPTFDASKSRILAGVDDDGKKH